MRYTIVPKALVPKFFRIICAKEIRLGPEAIHYATRLKKEVSAERIRIGGPVWVFKNAITSLLLGVEFKI